MSRIWIGLFGWIMGCETAERLSSEDRESANLERGESLFNLYCANCHGVDGDGGRAPSLLYGEPLEFSYDENREEILYRMRREGFEGVLSEEEVHDLVIYLFYIQGRY